MLLLDNIEATSSSLVDGLSEEVYARHVLRLIKGKKKTLFSEMQVITLGEIALVSIPGELFVEYGLEVKEKSKFPHTFIIDNANDFVGYIPTLRVFEEGGYEVRLCCGSKLDPVAGKMITGTALEMLDEMWKKR